MEANRICLSDSQQNSAPQQSIVTIQDAQPRLPTQDRGRESIPWAHIAYLVSIQPDNKNLDQAKTERLSGWQFASTNGWHPVDSRRHQRDAKRHLRQENSPAAISDPDDIETAGTG